MSSPNDAPAPEYPPLQARLKFAVVPVVVLMAGYFGSTYYFAASSRTETLDRLPERPALGAGNQALEPVLDEAIAAVEEEPAADHVGHLGKVYQANYFYDEAAACYRRAMELDPGNAQWPYLLAYLQDMKGETGGSAPLLDRAIELDRTYLPAILRRADNRYKTGDPEGAQSDYLRCLDLHMTNEYARLGLGRIAADREDWPEAEKQLRMAVEGNRRFGTAYRLLATVYEKQGKESEMRQALHAADPLGRFVASPDPWVDELEQYCYDTERLLTRAFRAEKIERWDEARRLFGRVLALDPDNFKATAQMGDLLQKQGRMQEAEPLLLKALTLPAPDDANHANVNTNLGNNYFWQQQPEKAAGYYQAALAMDPELEAAHQGLAACYLQLEQFDAAIEHAKQAAELNPESHEAEYNWGQALMHLGKLDEALPHFAEAARLNPALPPADYKAGAYHFKQGDMEKAVPYLEKALDTARAGGNHRLESQIRAMLGR